MASFLVRIELHNATWADYDLLHAQMDYRGFSREITGSDGLAYQLPTAEYKIQTKATLEQVRSLAAEAAKSTGKKFGAIVAEYSRSGWIGLEYA